MQTIYDLNLYETNTIRAYILSKEGREEFGSIVRDRYNSQHIVQHNSRHISQHILNNLKLSLFAHDVCDFTKVSLHLNEYYTIVRYELDL